MSCHFQKDVLEIWDLAPKLGHPNPVFGEALDDVRDEVLSTAAQREEAVTLQQVSHRANRAKTLGGLKVIARQHHRAVCTVLVDERVRRSDVDDAAVIDDRHAVAEA